MCVYECKKKRSGIRSFSARVPGRNGTHKRGKLTTTQMSEFARVFVFPGSTQLDTNKRERAPASVCKHERDCYPTHNARAMAHTNSTNHPELFMPLILYSDSNIHYRPGRGIIYSFSRIFHVAQRSGIEKSRVGDDCDGRGPACASNVVIIPRGERGLTRKLQFRNFL